MCLRLPTAHAACADHVSVFIHVRMYVYRTHIHGRNMKRREISLIYFFEICKVVCSFIEFFRTEYFLRVKIKNLIGSTAKVA